MPIDKAGKNVLLLIDEPKDLFRTLCRFQNREVNLTSFKAELEGTLGDKISESYAEAYFYAATVFQLLLRQQPGKYTLSATATLLCSIYDDPTKESEYHKTLTTLLLTNERKGELFQRFLDFIDFPKKDEEIYTRFGEVTGKSLINWLLEANLALKRGKFIGRAKREIPSSPTLEEFWNELKFSYDQMQATGVFGVKKLFVDIGELRLIVSCKMNLTKIEEFDKYLEALLESDYGRRISLAGAPVHILEERKDIFRYKDKTYLYLSIRG